MKDPAALTHKNICSFRVYCEPLHTKLNRLIHNTSLMNNVLSSVKEPNEDDHFNTLFPPSGL